jgi:hypothetical protein
MRPTLTEAEKHLVAVAVVTYYAVAVLDDFVVETAIRADGRSMILRRWTFGPTSVSPIAGPRLWVVDRSTRPSAKQSKRIAAASAASARRGCFANAANCWNAVRVSPRDDGLCRVHASACNWALDPWTFCGVATPSGLQGRSARCAAPSGRDSTTR